MERIEDLPPLVITSVELPPVTRPTFEGLYALEYRPIVRLAFVMLGRDGPAEEVVQDGFARVYERWDSLDSPGGYLRTCVVNGFATSSAANGWRSGDGPTRDRRRRARVDHLTDALAALPPKRRAAVVLRYYGDLSEAEIAATLGVRPGTVKSMLHRSLAQLRGVIER